MDILSQKLREIILPVLKAQDVELVDLHLKGRPGNQTVKVYIEAETGVTLETCTQVSRMVSDELDVADLMPGKYRLEVSSPGVTRPLKTSADFRRNLNRHVRITLESELESEEISGQIVDVAEKSIEILSAEGRKSLDLSLIKEGKITLPW